MSAVGSLIRATNEAQRTEATPRKTAAPAPTPAPAPASPAEQNAEQESDAELRTFLRGKTVTELVKSADGAFEAKSGDVIDDAMLAAAAAHDALLMLAVSVDA